MANIEMLREVTKSLLLVEPEKSEIPTFVNHPIFQSSTAYDTEPFDLFGDIDRARKPYINIIENAEDAIGLLIIVRNPYKMLWFLLASDYIDEPEYSDILKQCWVCEEWPSRDVNVPIREAIRLFKRADRNTMVPTKDETIKVYRGVNRGGSPYGLSWTTSLETAEWFAKRFGDDGKVYELEVPNKHVLAIIDDRDESEVVVDTRNLEDKVKFLKEV